MATEKASQNSEMDSTVTGGLQKLNVTGISSKQEEDDEYPDWVIPSTPEDLQEKKIVFPSKLTLCSRSRLLLFMTDSCLTGGVMSYIHVTSFSSNAAVHWHSKMCPGNCCCHRLKTAVFFSCTHMTQWPENLTWARHQGSCNKRNPCAWRPAVQWPLLLTKLTPSRS